MYYIKIESDTGVLLDAEAISSPVFVMWQERNQAPIGCSELKAQGIVSGNGSVTYQLEGKPPLPNAEPGMVATPIPKYEYLDCVEQLGDMDENPVPTPEPDPEQPEQPMNAARMRAEILRLRAQSEDLSARNEFFEDCLLEMSEIVYGGN